MTFKLYLDPGHGGTDPGAIGNGLKEKDITLKLSLMIRDILTSEYEGVEVKMSRTTDVYPSLPKRVDEANAWRADFFFSIHINAGGGTGFETLRANGVGGRTLQIQNIIHDEIQKVTGLRDRGKKESGVYVLRESDMPACLTESGFIDSVNDSAKMKDDNWLRAIARAHVVGLEKAFGLKAKEKVTAATPAPAPSEPKEAVKMDELFNPSAQALRSALGGLLLRSEMMPKEKEPLDQMWRWKLDNNQLTVSDAIGLLCVMIARDHINMDNLKK